MCISDNQDQGTQITTKNSPVVEAARPRPESLAARRGALGPARPLRRRTHVVRQEVGGGGRVKPVVCNGRKNDAIHFVYSEKNKGMCLH